MVSALVSTGCGPASHETGSVSDTGTAEIAAGSPPPAAGEIAPAKSAETSLLLVTLDTTRADHLAPYGARDIETPNLARLAADGVLFEYAVAVAPVTLPSHASLFTGLYPPRHGVRNNSIHYLDPSLHTLAEHLSSAGWRTAAFVSAAVLDRRFGLDQGFEVYEDDMSQGGPRRLRLNAERPAGVSLEAAGRWLDGVPAGEPFFLWVHLFDPHAPYDPPAPWSERYSGRPYEGEIAALDHALGRFLKHPRFGADQAMVMVVADHGESLGEHGEDTHAMLAYEATLRIPWIIRGPGLPTGRRVDEPVSQVDLLPTALELLGLDSVPEIDGRSLVPLMRGQEPKPAEAFERALYSETLVPFHTYGWSELSTVRRAGFKLISAPEPELYDLESDPGELENLYVREPARAEGLARDLAGFTRDAVKSSETPRDPEMEARLRSLGYLSAGASSGSRERLDPKRVIDLHLAVERGLEFFFLRRIEAADAELRRVVARDPDNLQALGTLAKIRVIQKRFEDAEKLSRRAVALDPENPDLHVVMGQVALGRGEIEMALTAFEVALEIDPRWLDAAIYRVRCLDRLGRRPEAVAALEEILARDPDHGRSQVAWAELVELPVGRLAAAEERLHKVTEEDPGLAEAWRVLGQVLEEGQRFEEAREIYRRGLEAVPGEGTLHARSGAVMARLGRPEEARRELELALAAGQNTASVHYGLASLAIRGGDWRRVEQHARRATELDPNLSGAWNLFAASQEELGRPSEALVAYDEAIRSDPDNERARFNRGLLLLRLERFAAAGAAFEEVLAQRKDHGGALFQLGLLYAGPLADSRRAVDYLRRSLEAEPDHPRAAEIRRLLGQD